MKRTCLFLLFTFGFLLSFSQFFHTSGADILSPEGKPFLIKGTNLGNWLVPEGYMFKLQSVNSPRLIDQAFTELVGPSMIKDFWTKFQDNYITSSDIQYLKGTGMNSIRVPFNYRLFTNEDYLGHNDSTRGFQLLDRLVKWCTEVKLYIILDMHCAPGGQTGDNIDDGDGYPFLFDSEENQQQTIRIWRKIAAHYANEPIIMGYDLLNEPIAHYFDSAHFNPRLEPLYKRIVSAIREVDRNHIMFLGGSQWDSNFRPFGKPFDKNLVYTFHKYWTPPTKAVIQDYIDFRKKFNVPVYVGETGENTDGWVDSFRVVCEQNNIGWHFWPYKKMDNTRGIVSFPRPANYEIVIKYAETLRNSFSDIRKARPADMNLVKYALAELLKNIRFENCKANEGYIKALGLNPLSP
ncbi:MAG: glycoside hydrolase family 5 protein [Flavisolibacter sp.]